MKNKKLRVLSISVLACLLLLTMIGVSGFAAQKQEDNEAFADVIQANELRFKVVEIPAEALQQQIQLQKRGRNAGPDAKLSKTELTQAAKNAAESVTVDLSDYFSENLAAKYQSVRNAKFQSLNMTDATVGSGMVESHLISTENVSDTQKNVKAKFVKWDARIYDCNDGKYMVTLIFSRDTLTTVTELEDGVWKTVGYHDDFLEFIPDSYDPVMGVFDSYEQALTCVQNLDVEAENPFS